MLGNRKILLTGGCGFIGHNLALTLKDLGAEVAIIDSLAVNNYYSVQALKDMPNGTLYLNMLQQRQDLLREKDIPLIVLDARDLHTLSGAIKAIDPDTIIHLAAGAHVNKTNKDPYATFEHSMRTLANTLELARSEESNVGHFVFFSSSMTYGHFGGGMVTEETPCNPLETYGGLKYGAERLVIGYNQVFGLPYTIIRPSALYGERCISRRVLQIFIENILQGKEVVVKGNGSDRLDFTYIGDLVSGVVQVLTQPKAKNELFNLTYGQSRSLLEVIEILEEHFPHFEVRFEDKDKLVPDRGTLSVDKARELIGYNPQFPIERGLHRYIQWYRTMIDQP